MGATCPSHYLLRTFDQVLVEVDWSSAREIEIRPRNGLSAVSRIHTGRLPVIFCRHGARREKSWRRSGEASYYAVAKWFTLPRASGMPLSRMDLKDSDTFRLWMRNT